MEAYFLSDIHLKSVDERNGKTLLRFFNSLIEQKKAKEKLDEVHLFLLGDIFDWWLSDHQVFIDKFFPVIEPIQKLIKMGVKVYFFEGNHDLHIHPYWADQLGAQVFTDPQYFKLGKWNVRCEHGDLINLEDKNYLRMRALFRHPWVETLGHKLPGAMWEKIGLFLSHKSRKFSAAHREDKEKQIIQMIHHHAERAFQETAFDFIITGHMHVRDEYYFSIGKNKAGSINLGSWFEEIKVLKLTDGGPEWLTINS